MNEPEPQAIQTQTYFIHGRFRPERANIQLTILNRKAKLENREVEFGLFAYGSEFNGTIRSARPFENHFEVNSIAYLLIRSVLDRLSYLNVCGYDFDLVGAISADRDEHQIFGAYEGIFFEQFEQQVSFSHAQIPFANDLLDLKFHDARLDHALRCFCHALRDKALTALFCYVAIEILARRVVEIADNKLVEDVRSDEWNIFRSKLNLRETTIKTNIKTLADDFRHGNFVNTSWEARKAILSLTWEIIRRAMHFMKSKTQLPPESFAEL